MTESDAYLYTRFTKEELHKLFVHLRLPLGTINVMEHKQNQYRYFTSEEIFLLSLTKIAHGLSWVLMGRGLFGGNPDYFGAAFRWFIDYVFVTFFNKISGDSFRLNWGDSVNDFRKIIHAKVEVSPCEIERVIEGNLDVT